jgi:hypothetical protein
MDNLELKNRFTFHPANSTSASIYEAMRARALELSTWMNENAPDSRELSLAITNLDQAVMWFNAAVARN